MPSAVFSNCCLPGPKDLILLTGEGKALTEGNKQLKPPGRKGTFCTLMWKTNHIALCGGTLPIVLCTKAVQVNSLRGDGSCTHSQSWHPWQNRWEQPACHPWWVPPMAQQSASIYEQGPRVPCGQVEGIRCESQGRLVLRPASPGLVNTEFSKTLLGFLASNGVNKIEVVLCPVLAGDFNISLTLLKGGLLYFTSRFLLFTLCYSFSLLPSWMLKILISWTSKFVWC